MRSTRSPTMAPVMIATASDILKFRGSMTATRRPKTLDVNAIRDLEYLRHVVADEDDREAPVAHLADQVEHHVRLLDAQRRGRLVHDHHVPREGRAARHRDTLALAAGKRLDRLTHGIDPDLEILHMGVGFSPHASLVQHAKQRPRDAWPADFASEEDVLGDIERGRQRKILVDGFDPMAPGVERTAELHGRAVDQNLALIRDESAR